MDSIFTFILPLIIMFALMYFMVIRPQKKQISKTQDMLSNLKAGDTVATIGGLHGVIDEVDQQAKIVVLDCEGVYLTFDLRAVSRVIASQTATEVVEQDSSLEE